MPFDGGRERGGSSDGEAALAGDRNQLVEARVDRRRGQVGVEHQIGLEERRAAGRDVGGEAPRTGAVVEVEQPALSDGVEEGGHRLRLGGEDAAHVVDDADVVRGAAEQPAQVVQVGLGGGCGGQRVRTGVGLRIPIRLERDLEQQFVAGSARGGLGLGKVCAVGREGEGRRVRAGR